MGCFCSVIILTRVRFFLGSSWTPALYDLEKKYGGCVRGVFLAKLKGISKVKKIGYCRNLMATLSKINEM